MNRKYFYDYNTFLREKFGEKVYKICLNAGFTCPNRDGTLGTNGCIYCNNASFSPSISYHNQDIHQQIREGIAIGQKYKANKFIAYFQPYTNTYAPVEKLEYIYQQVLQYPEIVGIAIGTRPDAVDSEKINLLAKLAQKTFISIEYGVQSIYDDTLKWIQRGHNYQSFLQAMAISQNKGLHLCAHLMIGFPQETKEQILATAAVMNQVGIQGIKLHNLLITKDTVLAQMYEKNPFPLLDFTEYVSLICDFLERLAPTIVCERLYANTSQEYLIAPSWPAIRGGQMSDAVNQELKRRESYQGRLVLQETKSASNSDKEVHHARRT